VLVAAIDVGSPAKVGWATNEGAKGCGSLDELIELVSAALRAERKVAVGFEAPCWVPRGRAYLRMTANRGGIEARMARPWSAGAGCGSLASGVANAGWFADALYKSYGPVRLTSLLDRYMEGSAQLFVWEAFVSGHLKAVSHEGDAQLAVEAFTEGWPKLCSAVDLEPCVNLLAAAFLAAEHILLPDEIGRAGLVIAAT
jgi:hypothetical protein